MGSRPHREIREESEALIAQMDEPWGKLANESLEAFAAFKYYRDTPVMEQSIPKCVESYFGLKDGTKQHAAKVSLWQQWSSRHKWQDRLHEWANEQDRVAREAKLQAIKEMNERHGRIAKAMIGKAAQRLSNVDPDDLTLAELRRWFMEAARLERGSLGEPEEIHQWRQDVNKMTDDELRSIIEG